MVDYDAECPFWDQASLNNIKLQTPKTVENFFSAFVRKFTAPNSLSRGWSYLVLQRWYDETHSWANIASRVLSIFRVFLITVWCRLRSELFPMCVLFRGLGSYKLIACCMINSGSACFLYWCLCTCTSYWSMVVESVRVASLKFEWFSVVVKLEVYSDELGGILRNSCCK